MAQRLEAIRAQQGRSETSPTTQTKVAPPAVNPNQQSSIQQKVDKVKQPVEPKTQSATGCSGSERVAAIRATAAAARERAMQNAPFTRRTIHC